MAETTTPHPHAPVSLSEHPDHASCSNGVDVGVPDETTEAGALAEVAQHTKEEPAAENGNCISFSNAYNSSNGEPAASNGTPQHTKEEPVASNGNYTSSNSIQFI